MKLIATMMMTIGVDSMGAIGVIAPKAKKLWVHRPKSPPQEFCYVNF